MRSGSFLLTAPRLVKGENNDASMGLQKRVLSVPKKALQDLGREHLAGESQKASWRK